MPARQTTKLVARPNRNGIAATSSPGARKLTLIVLSPPVTTEVFDTYWQFAAERQEIFFRRAEGRGPDEWTDDPILKLYRFTNTYRASDRVSQFLISRVQRGPCEDRDAMFFRTILFKLFNKIETWELLENALGPLHPERYCYESYDRVLTEAVSAGRPIYSAAYIMPSGNSAAFGGRKHRAHLALLQSMLDARLPSRLSNCGSMAEAFALLRAVPTIGDFLAYQYVTDLNYSTLMDFSELEFVMPGPGARSGIRKCFRDLGRYSEADIIKWVAERQEVEFKARGIAFRSLWGRPLQLIDCQNLFCEVDKYARVRHPAFCGLADRTRIKQTYRYNAAPVEYYFPPKWQLKDTIAQWRDC